MFKNLRIGSKILLIILATSLVALCAVSVISFNKMLEISKFSQNTALKLGGVSALKSKDALLGQAESYVFKLALEQATSVDKDLKNAQKGLLQARDTLESIYENASNFKGRSLPLPDETENNVFSSKYMLAPGVVKTPAIDRELHTISNIEYSLSGLLHNDEIHTNFYLGTKDGISYRYSKSNSYDQSYDVRKREWFIQAMAHKGNAVWLDTYTDNFGYTVVTIAVAYGVYGQTGQKEFRGVIATDITLNDIQNKIINTEVGKGGFSFIIDHRGNYIAHPNYMEEGFNTNAFEGAAVDRLEVLEAMAKGESGITKLGGEIPLYTAYVPLATPNWSLGMTIPIDEIIEPANKIQIIINDFTNEAQERIHATLTTTLLSFIVLFALCAMLLVFFSFILSKHITRDIQKLIAGTDDIGRGNFDIEIKASNKDEVGELIGAFNDMSQKLKQSFKTKE